MTNEEFNEKLILFEYEKYYEKEYNPMSYSKFVTKKLIEARIELSKLHQPTVISAVCDCKRCEDIYRVDVYKCGKCHLKVRT